MFISAGGEVRAGGGGERARARPNPRVVPLGKYRVTFVGSARPEKSLP